MTLANVNNGVLNAMFLQIKDKQQKACGLQLTDQEDGRAAPHLSSRVLHHCHHHDVCRAGSSEFRPSPRPHEQPQHQDREKNLNCILAMMISIFAMTFKLIYSNARVGYQHCGISVRTATSSMSKKACSTMQDKESKLHFSDDDINFDYDI